LFAFKIPNTYHNHFAFTYILLYLEHPAHPPIVHVHHIGSQENKVVPEEHQETPVQGLPEGHEPEEEL